MKYSMGKGNFELKDVELSTKFKVQFTTTLAMNVLLGTVIAIVVLNGKGYVYLTGLIIAICILNYFTFKIIECELNISKNDGRLESIRLLSESIDINRAGNNKR